MDTCAKGRQDLAGYFLDVLGPVLISWGHDFDERHETVAADMSDGQRTAVRQSHWLKRMLATGARRRFDHGHSPSLRRGRLGFVRGGTGMQRKHVGNRLTRMLLGQSIITSRQKALVQ